MKYPINGTLMEIMQYTLRAKRFEPISIKGSVIRKNVSHRFAINVQGAKSAYQIIAENITANNGILQRMMSNK